MIFYFFYILLLAWTILTAFEEFPTLLPCLVAMYTGYKDPTDFDLFLEDTINEDIVASCEGILVNPETNFFVFVDTKYYVADAPARAKMLNILGHNGKRGCPCCSQVGCKRGRSSIQFHPKIVEPLRTNESFRYRDDPLHFQPSHRDRMGKIEETSLDMVLDIVFDAMHTLDLGCMKKMVRFLFEKNLPGEYKLNDCRLKTLSENYSNLKDSKPIEMSRRPRSLLDNFRQLKASETRGITLYYGFYIFKYVLHPFMYQHLLKYMVAVRIFADENSDADMLDKGQKLMEEYVSEFTEYYGPNLSYVIHMCLHIKQYVVRHGPIYSFSAYMFENHLRVVKGDVHVPNRVLQQVHRRTEERGMLRFRQSKKTGLSNATGLNDNTFFKYCFGAEMTIDGSNDADAYVSILLNDSTFIGRVLSFEKRDSSIVFRYRSIKLLDTVFTVNHEEFSISSSQLGIYICCENFDVEEAEADFKCISGKYMFIQQDPPTTFMLIPFLHNIPNTSEI